MNAVLYIRVSTIDQAVRGDEPEGFSIPAQREACRRKAKIMKAIVVDEYVDRGESARSADRPELQRLLADLSGGRQIDYIIVHKVDRLARSLNDDVMIGLAIQKAGAKLVSVTENIDDTPSGRLLHGIMATIAEFYSRNLAAEALKGCTEKAKRGGTPFRAALGYINVSQQINERRTSTVVIDEERAQYVKWAFKKYATGRYTIRTLTLALNRRGFRNRRTGRSARKPLSTSSVAKMLHNRYYLGYVTYRGIEYRGKHKPLVSAALFATVQAILQDANKRGAKVLRHNHDLNGFVYCAQCHRKLGVAVSKHKYMYLYCPSRQHGTPCQLPYLPVDHVERMILNELARLNLTEKARLALQKEIRSQLKGEVELANSDVARQEQRMTRLLAERQRILDAYYDETITKELFGSEQKRINIEIEEVQGVLAEAQKARTFAHDCKEAALNMATTMNLREAYTKARPELRKFFNRALFDRLYINDRRLPSHRVSLRDISIVRVEYLPDIDFKRLAQAVIGLSYKPA